MGFPAPWPVRADLNTKTTKTAKTPWRMRPTLVAFILLLVALVSFAVFVFDVAGRFSASAGECGFDLFIGQATAGAHRGSGKLDLGA